MKSLLAATASLLLLFSAHNLAEPTHTESKMDIDVAWGGYYLSKDPDSDQYSVFRLLDFNRQAYHAAIFQEGFSEVPKPEALLGLTPFIGHAPIDARALLNNHSLTLVASAPLTAEDLEGYHLYLEHHEVPSAEIEKLFSTITRFSQQAPLKLSLELVEGELQISER